MAPRCPIILGRALALPSIAAWQWMGLEEGKKGSRDEDILFNVAASAVTEAGEVIGMIPASDALTSDDVARLVAPPPIKGGYVLAERLTELQKAAAARG